MNCTYCIIEIQSTFFRPNRLRMGIFLYKLRNIKIDIIQYQFDLYNISYNVDYGMSTVFLEKVKIDWEN